MQRIALTEHIMHNNFPLSDEQFERLIRYNTRLEKPPEGALDKLYQLGLEHLFNMIQS